MKKTFFLTLLVSISFFNCSTDNNTIDETPISNELYFPPINSNEWETLSISDLQWNESALQPLLNYVESKNTKAFLILKNGKIVVEWYSDDFSAIENHSWNSAAKTLTAFTVGIAQEEGLLDINDASQDYLGINWSSMTDEQEKNITIWHHLTMTTGMDYTVDHNSCTDPTDLLYKNESGSYWYYHNAGYRLNLEIIESATGMAFQNYFNEKIKNKIGMQGAWVNVGCFDLYFSTARCMARFGLLSLNKGKWEDDVILNDDTFFSQMTNTSQNLNKAYGYLWWLNGKDNFRLPATEEDFTGKLIPNAPNDLFAGLGKDDQKVYIIPSENMVVIRLGDNAGVSTFGPSSFDNELWGKINTLTN